MFNHQKKCQKLSSIDHDINNMKPFNVTNVEFNTIGILNDVTCDSIGIKMTHKFLVYLKHIEK